MAVPSGEAESSEQSFNSTTSSDDVPSRERHSPLFERVTHSHSPMPSAGTRLQPQAGLSDVTESDLQDLSNSATTTRSVSTSGNGRGDGIDGGALPPPVLPIKGILKHSNGRGAQSAAPSVPPTSKGTCTLALYSTLCLPGVACIGRHFYKQCYNYLLSD